MRPASKTSKGAASTVPLFAVIFCAVASASSTVKYVVHAGGPGSSGRFGDAAHTFFPLRLNIV